MELMSKRIYDYAKDLLKDVLKISKQEFDGLLLMDHEDAMSKVGAKLLMARGNLDMMFVDLFDDVYFFKRSLHLVVSNASNQDLSGCVDTTRLSELKQDIFLDTRINGKEVCINLQKRNYPIYLRNTTYNWTISVLTNIKEKDYLMSINESDKLVKVLLDADYCKDCGKCKEASCGKLYIRPRNREKCIFNNIGLSPLEIVSFIMTVVNDYLDKTSNVIEVIESDKLKKRAISVANEDTGEDTYSTVSKRYIYKDRSNYEYKGGHHKSPACHTRSGYYRRCKHGSYILEGDEFIKVPKGLGNFTYVRSTVVNAHSDSVNIKML